jgi:hypothetical protein
LFINFLTFILHAQNEAKRQPFTYPPGADSLCCSQRTGDIGKTLTLRRVAYPFFAALPGCVKWPIKHFIPANNAKTLLGQPFIHPLQGWLLNQKFDPQK